MVQSAQDGSEEALNGLVERHYHAVYAYFYKNTGQYCLFSVPSLFLGCLHAALLILFGIRPEKCARRQNMRKA